MDNNIEKNKQINALKKITNCQNPRENYQIVKKIDNGAFGNVYLANNDRNAKFAIKKLNLNKISIPALINEIKIMKILKHPNIVTYCESYKYRNYASIVMAFEPNFTLESWSSYKDLNSNQIAAIMADIAKGLNYIHKKVN